MPNDTTSPLATYISHLEKGELAYQFSPAAQRAVFFPRLVCPFTGSESSNGASARGAAPCTPPPWCIRPRAPRSTWR